MSPTGKCFPHRSMLGCTLSQLFTQPQAQVETGPGLSRPLGSKGTDFSRKTLSTAIFAFHVSE